MQAEELPVGLGVGQVVARDVGHGGQALEDAVMVCWVRVTPLAKSITVHPNWNIMEKCMCYITVI